MNFKHPLVLSTAALVVLGISSITYRVLADDAEKKSTFLPVPTVWQAPGNNWKNPWGNACEEASIAMVAAYYADQKITQTEANAEILRLVAWEDEFLGHSEDASADEIAQLIEATTSFKGYAFSYPTIDDIVNEVRERRPVIALINQFDFYKKTPSKQPGVSSHVFVISGYDDTKKQFAINDPADGKIRRYSYDRLMNALRDLDDTGEAYGKPVVVFTNPE